MAKPTPVKKPAVKAPAKPKRYQDAMAFLASMESVAIAEDKKVSVDAPVQKDVTEEVTGAVIPNQEVGASDKGVATIQPGPKDGGGNGTAVTQEVGKVTVKQTTDAGNAGEEDAVSGKTPDAVKAGEKDITTGVVSKEDNIEANEAEHIEPKAADDAVMNVDNAVEQLEADGVTLGAEASLQRAEAVSHDLENINKVEAALEQFQGLLAGMKAKGKRPTSELTQAIRIALESHDRAFFKPVISSLEDYARPDTHLVASMGLEAAIGDKLKELGKAAGNAVMKVIEMLMDAWAHLSRDTPKLVMELDGIAKGMKSANLDTSKKLSVQGASRLMINGEFAGDSVEVARNVEKVSRELLVEWPQALRKLVDTIEAGAKQVANPGSAAKANDSASVETAAQTALEATFHSFKQVDSGDAPSSIADFPIITRSPIMPGNHAMFIGVSDDTSASNQVASSSALMGFAFERTGDRDGGDGEVNVPSPERAVAAINAIKDIVGNLIGKDTSTTQLKELRKVLQSKESRWGENGGRQNSGNIARGAIQAALMQHRQYMGWLISLVKAYIGFYREVLGKSGSTDVAERSNSSGSKTSGKTTDHAKETDDESVVSVQ